MMTRTALAAAVLSIGLTSPSRAQLAIRLDLECASILQFEQIEAVLTVQNTSRTPLVIMPGDKQNNATLRFLIERKRFQPLAKVDKRPLVEKLVVRPDKTQKVALDLSQWYTMGKVGRYIVRAEIEWGTKTHKSNAVMVDVVRGLELVTLRRDVPGANSGRRTYTLRYWSRARSEQLFLCVDDEEAGLNYGVFRLGPIIRLKKPYMKIDAQGYVTVLHQSGPDRFTRSGLRSSRNGVTFIGQAFELEDGKPYPVRPELPLVEPPVEKDAAR